MIRIYFNGFIGKNLSEYLSLQVRRRVEPIFCKLQIKIAFVCTDKDRAYLAASFLPYIFHCVLTCICTCTVHKCLSHANNFELYRIMSQNNSRDPTARLALVISLTKFLAMKCARSLLLKIWPLRPFKGTRIQFPQCGRHIIVARRNSSTLVQLETYANFLNEANTIII